MAEIKELWRQLLEDINTSDAEKPLDKAKSVSSDKLMIAQSNETDNSQAQYDKRDTIYTDLLDEYKKQFISKSKWNKWYKLAFFVLAMLVFVGLIFASMHVLFIVANKGDTNAADIAVVVGSTAGIISAIIVLPKIIAEHLFPTDDQSRMIDMVKNMQVNDSKIRTNKNKENDKS